MYEVESITPSEGRPNPCLQITIPTYTLCVKVFVDHWDGISFYATFMVEVLKTPTGTKVVDYGSTPKYTFATCPAPETMHKNQFFVALAWRLRSFVFTKYEKSAKAAVKISMHTKWCDEFLKRPSTTPTTTSIM